MKSGWNLIPVAASSRIKKLVFCGCRRINEWWRALKWGVMGECEKEEKVMTVPQNPRKQPSVWCIVATCSVCSRLWIRYIGFIVFGYQICLSPKSWLSSRVFHCVSMRVLPVIKTKTCFTPWLPCFALGCGRCTLLRFPQQLGCWYRCDSRQWGQSRQRYKFCTLLYLCPGWRHCVFQFLVATKCKSFCLNRFCTLLNIAVIWWTLSTGSEKDRWASKAGLTLAT